MLGPRRIRSFTLFIIGLEFLNITYTMISWHKPLALPIRKGKEYRKESSWLDDPKNDVKSKKTQAEEVTESSHLSSLITLWTKEINVDNYKLTTNVEFQPDTPETTTVETQTSSVQKKGTDKKMRQLLCPKIPPGLGPIQVNKTDMELDFVEKKFPEVHWGGRYFPPNCIARHKVAIIAPYRDRQKHLVIFLNHLHPFLMKQQIEYGIFIIEQEGRKKFNRAKLMNVGFVEAQRLKAGGWQCFIFHDIDLLPLDTRNMYSCPRQPRHMSAAVDKLNFMLPYEEIFGGISALTLEQFTKINGFSNKYWGWGGEDDDIVFRLKERNYHIARYKMSIARYAMLDHKKSVPSSLRYQYRQTSEIFRKDGLSTLEYELVQVMQYHLYTHILVNIDERSWWMYFAKLLFGDDR